MAANLALAPPMPQFRDATGHDPDLALRAQRWLEQLDDKWLACRYAHAFPKIMPRGGKLGRGVTARPAPNRVGHVQIRQTCRDCGIVRVFVTSGNLFARGRSYTYDWPEGYRMPKGASAYVTIDDINDERNRRTLEALGLSFADLAQGDA